MTNGDGWDISDLPRRHIERQLHIEADIQISHRPGTQNDGNWALSRMAGYGVLLDEAERWYTRSPSGDIRRAAV